MINIRKYRVVYLDESAYSLLKRISGELDILMKDIVTEGLLLIHYFMRSDTEGFKNMLKQINYRLKEQKAKRDKLLAEHLSAQ